MGVMLCIKKSIFLSFTILCLVQSANAQYTHYQEPTASLFQKGIQALHLGDSLTAYQQFAAVYNFKDKNDDIVFNYLNLSLALDKQNVVTIADNWINNANNKIYIAKLNFQLGKYYFRHKQDVLAINAFNNTNIAVLENNDIVYLKYAQGYLYFKSGDWNKASTLLNNIKQLKNNPFYTDANYYAGFIALEKKDYKEALNSFQIAASNKQYSPLVPFYLSQIYYFIGNVEEALAQCEKALKLKDQFYKVQLEQLMGHLLFEKKQYKKALPYLENYVKNQKNADVQDIYQLSYCYYQDQNWEKAINGFKKLANVEDSLGQNSMYLLATTYLKVNNKQGARNAFLMCWTKSQNLEQKEISLFNYAKLSVELKDYTTALAALEKYLVNYTNTSNVDEAKDLWIIALTNSNNYVLALDDYLSIEKPSTELLKIYPNILYGRACLYLNDGQLEKAYELFNSLAHTPYNSKVLSFTFFWLGELSYKMDKPKESVEYLEKYLSDPVELDQISIKHARYNLGYGYMKTGNFQKAIENFYAARLYDPINTFEPYQKDAFLRTADCHMMIKQYRQALQVYQVVIDSNWASMDYATLQKAIILGGQGKVNEKINLLKQFENQYSASQYINDARIELADTYSNQEKFAEALSPLQKILADNNAVEFFPQAYYKIGLVYFNLNKNEPSIQAFKSLFKAYPNSEEANNAVEFVRNIYVEDQAPEKFVQFMNDFGRSLTVNEQDSLIYRAAIIKYEQKKYNEAAIGFVKYLNSFPTGKYQLEANNYAAEIYYSKDQYDSAAKYFGSVANQSPNKYGERAALLAARLNYFNLSQYHTAEKYYSILDLYATQQENKFEANKGLLRCQFKSAQWSAAFKTAQNILQDKASATDDIQMANMIIYHNYILSNDTTNALKKLEAIIKFNPSLITAEAHYQIASILLAQNKLSQAEKTAFDVIKKQSAYEYWVTKTYILLGDIYLAQKDEFNAIATYKSVIENGTIAELKQIATDKLNLLSAKTNNKN